MNLKKYILQFIILLVIPSFALASGGDSQEAMNQLFLGLISVILAAKLGGEVAIRFGQPAVLGELLFGVLLGNLTLFNIHTFTFLKEDQTLATLSELGVIFLLFQVGLETNIKEMKTVGVSAFLAAVLGVIVPFVLGFLGSHWQMPEANYFVHIFVGATLTATSVGITARVLKDIGKIKTKESQIILGAAVIDDVLGLIVLAVVVGMIEASSTGTAIQISDILVIAGKAFGFLLLAIVFGQLISKKVFIIANNMRVKGLLLSTSLFFCFLLSYLAAKSGLAPIVGAFTAGLILDPVQYKDLMEQSEEGSTIEHLIEPIAGLLVPIFFVIMGASVDLSVFSDTSTLAYAGILTVAAIIGKQVCGLGVIEKGVSKSAIGFGMIPRGEVGLIFIGIGSKLLIDGAPVVDAKTFGAVVIMVIVTTMITPPLIKWKFSKI